MTIKPVALAGLAVAGLGLLGLMFPVVAQTHVPAGATESVLIDEIRALRRSMDGLVVSSLRSLVLLEEIRIQRNQVEKVESSLMDLDSQIAEVEASNQKLSALVKIVEVQTQAEGEAARRAEGQRQLAEYAAEIEAGKSRVEAARQRRAQLAPVEGYERAKLGELEQSLKRLEALLSTSQVRNP